MAVDQMYKKILVPLDNSATDKAILGHIRSLAKLCSAKLLLVHVADGFVARNQSSTNLAESEEMRIDRQYLETQTAALLSEGFSASYLLLCGEPAAEILKAVGSENCDLIAMATHGHGPVADLVLGSVAEQIRHKTDVPVLMLRSLVR